MEWVKPDSAPEQMQKDAAECRDAAWREASRYSYYPYYSYSPYSPRARFYGPPGVYYYQDRFYEEERLTQFCMQAKGYRLEPTAKE